MAQKNFTTVERTAVVEKPSSFVCSLFHKKRKSHAICTFDCVEVSVHLNTEGYI